VVAQKLAPRQDAGAMRVLIAFDKFKGALTAPEACEHVVRVLNRARPGWQLDVAPLADGGDGFCRVLCEAAGGVLQLQRASGALFARGAADSVDAPIGWVDLARLPAPARTRLGLDGAAQRLAIIEMAAVNGLAQVPPGQRDVWRSSSRGTGELIAAAAAQGAGAILLGVGGSATSDLGLGALAALGLRCQTAAGDVLDPPLPADWPRIARLSGTLGALPQLRIACDVHNPLLGARGAAAVYGPQKGLLPADLPRFEQHAERLARLLCAHAGAELASLDAPGAGAAGGIAFGLAVAAVARLVAGFELVAEWLDLERRRASADWVLTGEGRFDATSLSGKGPGALLQGAGARCVVFAGSVQLTAAEQAGLPGVELVGISPAGLPLEQALPAAGMYLERAVESWLSRQPE
jgi:glycerate kinase